MLYQLSYSRFRTCLSEGTQRTGNLIAFSAKVNTPCPAPARLCVYFYALHATYAERSARVPTYAFSSAPREANSHEENLSAQPPEARQQARFPLAHGDEERPQAARPSPRQRPQAPYDQRREARQV